MARTVRHLTAVEAKQWKTVTSASAAVALFVALAAFGLLGSSVPSLPPVDRSSTVVTSTTQQAVPGSAASTSVQDRPAAAPRASTKTTTSTSAGDTTIKTESKTTTPATDTSLVGQTLANPAVPWLIALVLSILAGYLAGAATQRVLLGQYGITIGPVVIPNVTPPLGAEGVSAANMLLAAEAIDPRPAVKAADGPELAVQRRATRLQLLTSAPGALRRPIPVPRPRAIVLADRDDLVAAINRAATQRSIGEASPADRLLALVEMNAVNRPTANAARKLLEIGDRVQHGERVDAELATFLSEQYSVAIQRIDGSIS